MFVSYAITFVCAVFPCTNVVLQHTGPVQVSWGHPQPQQPQIPFLINHQQQQPSYFSSVNISNQVFKVDAVQVQEDHASSSSLDFPNEDPNVYPIIDGDDNDLEISTDSPIARIRDGTLKGFIMTTISNRSFAAFKSIPFAQPPIGELRFKAPVKNSPWTGIREAIADAPTCIQADYMQLYKIHGQEDCLYLNVFTPEIRRARREHRKLGHGGQGLPVMVFIHGGGWFFSSSSLYGPSYLLDEDVVLVSMNYRLSMFGFLSTGDDASPGNNGLKDQTMALQWVKDNIASFGGDPSRVTIFGESAGAGSVHLHMFSRLSQGLFHGGISQSGCATCFWSISEKAVDTTRKYASLLNCTGDSKELVECLRTKDANTLAGTQLALLEWTTYPVVIFGPVIEPRHPGAFLDEHPETIYKRNGIAKVPWISGFNKDEGAINIATVLINNQSTAQLNTDWDKYGPLFLDLKNNEPNPVEIARKVREFYLGDEPFKYENKDKAIKMFSDRYMIACGVKGILLHAKYSLQPVYSYRLSFNGKYGIVQLLGQKTENWGVSHLDDLIYLFNNTAYYPNLQLEDEEYKMSKVVINLWTNFAKMGKPYLTVTENNNGSGGHVGNNLVEIWTPVSKPHPGIDLHHGIVDYLDLNLIPSMIADPYYERVKFWQSLGLIDQ